MRFWDWFWPFALLALLSFVAVSTVIWPLRKYAERMGDWYVTVVEQP